MSLKIKGYTNPKFQAIQLAGKLNQLFMEEYKAFVVGSDELVIQYVNDKFVIQFDCYQIQSILVVIDEEKRTFNNVKTLDDCLAVVGALRYKSYWKHDHGQLFIYLFIRTMIATILYYQQYKNSPELDVSYNWMKLQYEISKLFLGIFEKENIKSSLFVETKRAECLLVLNLNPKEQYSSETIRQLSKSYLKLLHPDVLPGAVEVFKLVNDAQRYLK